VIKLCSCGKRWLVVVVVVLVPIAFLVPAVLMFIPPLMPLTPATLPGRVQFTTLVICPSAVAPVFFDCLVEFMLRADNSALASADIFRLKARQYGAKQNSCEKGY
jgi:ABC-type sugar transport system permease subunit